jgi:hypothetical protein
MHKKKVITFRLYKTESNDKLVVFVCLVVFCI